MRLLIFFSLLSLGSFAQSIQQQVKKYQEDNIDQILQSYRKFISIPNVSTDTPNIRLNAEHIRTWMDGLGLQPELLHGTTTGVTPAVFAEVKVPNATHTIVFYAHYDGQPVNPAQWAKGIEPFNPVLITVPFERGGEIIPWPSANDKYQPGWRITGRGSADDKAGILTVLEAYKALLKNKITPSANIKFFFEGEEEVGSPHLAEILTRNREKLRADCWIIADGPRHASGKKLVQFGVRGDVNIDLVVYGPKRPLHSGNYGNWAPNPAQRLVQLLAGMKNDSGRVLIKGFYDDVIPPSPSELEALKKIPSADQQLRNELGIAEQEVKERSLYEGFMLPSLNINGIQSANAGRLAANIIPTRAEATLDLRLVKGNDVTLQVEKVIAHIRAQGFHVIDHEPTDEERKQHSRLIKITTGKGYNAQRTPMDLPIAKIIIAAVQSTSNDPIILQPTAGGSLPLILIENILSTKVITVPVVNYDNNQHAENENVQIGFLMEGIGIMAALLTMKFR